MDRERQRAWVAWGMTVMVATVALVALGLWLHNDLPRVVVWV